MQQRPFTVILILPDFLAGQYGEDFALIHCAALDPETAASAAQEVAVTRLGDGAGSVDPVDFAVVGIFEGYHENLKDTCDTCRRTIRGPSQLSDGRIWGEA